MISEIIKLAQANHFKGAGEYTEIAKGKNELVITFGDAKEKIKRIWQSKRL
jgi:hypothetical protein